MRSKTHQTAVAIVPPQEVWAPIQAIREKHDRQFRRWMPHINLLYPFCPPEEFDQILPALVTACAKIAPFVLSLAEFRFFRHSSRKATLWLAPEPTNELVRLQAALQAACPDCDDLSRFAAGFTPHLSVGQARSTEEAQKLADALQAGWQPVRFEMCAVALLRRERDTPFEIERWIALDSFSRPETAPVSFGR
jgi:2'-5' RNA ligase